MRFKVGIDPQTLPYGYQNEIMYHPCLTGVSETIRSNVPNLIKDVPNLMKNVQNFVNDVPRVPDYYQKVLFFRPNYNGFKHL